MLRASNVMKYVKKSNRLNILGVVITATYILFVGWIVCPQFNFNSLQKLPLNELGDFLAGVFGPLALAWLIIGYFQQQKELRLNTEALKIQADELKKTTMHQEEISILTQKQLEHDQGKSMPKFIVMPRFDMEEENRIHSFDIKLINGQAFNIRSYITEKDSTESKLLDQHHVPIMKAGEKFTLTIVQKPNTEYVVRALIFIAFKNHEGSQNVEHFPVTNYRGQYLEDNQLPSSSPLLKQYQ